MSYIEEIDLFTSESRLEKDWNASAVFIYDTEIIVEVIKPKICFNNTYYIPFKYNNKKVILRY